MEENISLRNISSSPHVRSKISTGNVMYDVFLALVPTAMVGVYHFGISALMIILLSIITCCLTEFVFDYVAHKPNTLTDGSAAVTGMLLALVLPPAVPLFIPVIGGIFAILFVKSFFGGLGRNFMNPALAARCLLLISFGTLMTDYSTDAVTGATPLAMIAEGKHVAINQVYLGTTTGVIGLCAFTILLGGIYLLAVHVITWQIPVSMIAGFVVMELFLGQCPSWQDIFVQVFAGGIMLGAFFMATDPVTSPMTEPGQLLYGAFTGCLCSIFRVYGASADSVSYAIIFSNLLTPLIDRLPVPKPMGVGIEGDQKDVQAEKQSFSIPKAAITLCAITLFAGVALGGVNYLTRDRIKELQLMAEAESYLEVLPEAKSFDKDDAIAAAVEELGGEIYGTDFGKSIINEVFTGLDDAGNVVGYAFSVTSNDAFDGSLTLSVGIAADGTVTGISFTEINETAGMGMNADQPEWKAQFAGVKTDRFTLNKSGGATADNDINSVSGASVTSGAVVNAVNAALDFFAANMQ